MDIDLKVLRKIFNKKLKIYFKMISEGKGRLVGRKIIFLVLVN